LEPLASSYWFIGVQSFRIFKRSFPSSECQQPYFNTDGMLNHGLASLLRSEMLIINWVLSHPPSHNLEYAQQHYIIRQKWCIHYFGAKEGLNGTSKLSEEVFQIHNLYFYYITFFLLDQTYDLHMMYYQRKQYFILIDRWFYEICRHQPETNTAALWPLFEICPRGSSEGKFFQWIELQEVPPLFTLLRKKTKQSLLL
jgi:hypothetical protein